MPDPRSPGQVCYEAFDAAFPADRFVRLTWDEQAPAVHRTWEAAAQAVREAHASLCPICGAELARCNAKEPSCTD